MSTTFESLSDILVRDYRLTPERLRLDVPLESLGIDSLGTVELLWTIEETFKIKLPPDPEGLNTLGDLVECVDALLARRGLAGVPAAPAAPTLRAT